jgi:circadian clock protein KaiB
LKEKYMYLASPNHINGWDGSFVIKENSIAYVYDKGLEYILRLRVTGKTSRSQDALMKVREICEQELHGFYKLEVIYQEPDQTDEGQSMPILTLIRRLPLPLKKLIGDLSNKERVISGLEIVPMERPIRESYA